VHVGLEADAGHADRIGNTILTIDNEFLRHHVENVPVARKRHVARIFEKPLNIVLRYFGFSDRDHPPTLETLDMVAGDTDDNTSYRQTRRALGIFDSMLDRLNRLVDIDDDASVQSLRWRQTDTQDVYPPDFIGRRDHGTNLGSSDVYANNNLLFHLTA